MASVLPYRSDTEAVVPSAMRGYPNGRIPPELLHPCGIGRLKMVEPAATAMRAMVAAAASDSVQLSATGTWRTYDQQKSLFLERYVERNTGKESKNWEGRTYWKLPDVASAASPGTSNHGLGLAADLSDSPSVPIGAGPLRWLSEHGPSFGYWNTVRSETWHWTYCLGDETPTAVQSASGMRTFASTSGQAGGTVALGDAMVISIPYGGELTKGAVGNAVRAVQSKLVALGHHIKVDGDFGNQTLAAVIAMQTASGLAADGRVGRRTWAALGLPTG